MDPSISHVLHALGLDHWAPLLLALMAAARALEVLIPQPQSGSHWLPLRKLLSLVAFSVGNAKPSDQPPLVTWLQRMAQAIIAAVPPPVAPVVPAIPAVLPNTPAAPSAATAPAVPAAAPPAAPALKL